MFIKLIHSMRKIVVLLICVFSGLFVVKAQYKPYKGTDTNPVLTIEGGKIIGVETCTPGVNVYRGIPYAAPPVGDLRWKEAQPVIPWVGIKCADEFGAAAMQVDRTPGEFYQIEFFPDGDPVRSEDCLYLNVWTSAAGKTDTKLPVAMWIHGGGMMQGFGHEMEFDGEALAKRGVILVTINYRLGLSGFFVHPLLTKESKNHSSGNYGILDQLAALKWINKNIRQFGGDPNNVMIFGQSGGGRSVQTLVASPLTKDLVHKAVIHSSLYSFPGVGSGTSGGNQQPLLADLEKLGKDVLDYGNIKTLEEMRAISLDELQDLITRYSKEKNKSVSFIFNIDNYLTIGNFPDLAAAGKILNIPYMIGYCGDDIKIADGTGTMESTIKAFSLAIEQHGHQPAFCYLFDRKMPGDDAGAFHSSELWYVFGTLDRCWRPLTPADYLLSEKMMNYWTNFAKTGDPNGKGLSLWERCSKNNNYFHLFNIE